ncbi:MAG TPA: glycosyltransferase [Allosphingosinicella sp.]|nr:glycosyltransferase [Allosphingosinicella sp.]
MSISIEVPVFKGAFLRPCIDSVLAQTSDLWTLSLVWDGGDAQSREILDALEREDHPRIRVHFTENQGIARARKHLTDRSEGAWLLPLDDDDILPPQAVARFLHFATEHPWASLIRARRELIDAKGARVDNVPMGLRFPFAPRTYSRGMVTDLFNQTHPYLIRRSAYERTQGWRGYADFKGAGEDCDIFLQLEEVAHFELLDEILYHYRLHGARASEAITAAAAYEMWRRLADDTLARLGLPLERASAFPPFAYAGVPVAEVSLDDVDFIVSAIGGRAGASLRRCGIADEAIHAVAEGEGPGGWQMAGFRTTTRRLVCFLDEPVEIATAAALEMLVQAMNRTEADLLAPRLRVAHDPAPQPPPHFRKILLMRREVILATGGFDDRCVAQSLQGVDLWLQARRRNFHCVEIPVAGIAYRGPPACEWPAADVAALLAKWRSHAALLRYPHVPRSWLEPSRDSSMAAGDGARR